MCTSPPSDRRPTLLTRLREALALPVLMKEMRTQMRGWRAPVILALATGLTIAAGLCILVPQYRYFDGTPEKWNVFAPQIGRKLFFVLAAMQGALAVLIAPALTAGAIAGERERQTLDFLLLTRLSGANIALGKLFSSLSFLFLTMLGALPVSALAFFFGGVAPGELLWMELLILAVTIGFGAISLACSARLHRAGSATALAYGLCVAWLVLMPGVGWLLEQYQNVHFQAANVYVRILLAVGMLVLLALLRTATVRGGVFLVNNRHLLRIKQLKTWSVFAILASLLVYLPDTDALFLSNLFCFANPLIAFREIVGAAFAPSSIPDDLTTLLYSTAHSPWELAMTPGDRQSLLAAIGLLLAAACLAVLFTARELQRLRR